MIFACILLLQSVLSETSLIREVKSDIAHVVYDSLHVSGNIQLLKGASWEKVKPFIPGNNLIRVHVGKRYKLVPINVRIFGLSWKSKRYIRKSTKLNKNDFVHEYHDITYAKHRIVTLLPTMFAAKSFQAGTILSKHHVRQAFDCKFGDKLYYLYSGKGLKIKLQGTALNEAHIGDVVTLRLNDSGKKIKGRLSAKGIVTHENI